MSKKMPIINEAVPTEPVSYRAIVDKKPKKQEFYSKKDLLKFVNGLTDQELHHVRIVSSTSQVATKIVILAQAIQRHDASFQNLTSEIPRAEKAAADMVGKYDEIMALIPYVPDRDAAVVIEGLRITDYMYMRVLGDRLKRIREGVDMEEKIKRLWWDDSLKIKANRQLVRDYVMNNRIPVREYGDLSVGYIEDISRGE